MKQIKKCIDEEKNIIVLTVIGCPNADDYIKEINDTLEKYPQKFTVCDYTEADLSGLSAKELERIKGIAICHPNTHVMKKVALILPSDLAYGLGRMFQMIGVVQDNPWELMPFRNTEDAFQWIGVNDIRKTAI